jgi:hypothetical protein
MDAPGGSVNAGGLAQHHPDVLLLAQHLTDGTAMSPGDSEAAAT